VNLSALLAGVVLLAVNGFFVAAEFALLAARRSRLEQLAVEGDSRARSALAGVKELSLMLAGAQLGITMASLGLGAVTEPAVHHGLEELLQGTALPAGVSTALSLTLALGLVVFLHMVVGEMAPKSWAISHPEESALILAKPFRGFTLVLRPFIWFLNTAANAVVRAVGVTPRGALAHTHSASDLALLLDESVVQGTLPAEQHELLSRALDLPQLDAEAVMVPRNDVVALPVEAGVAEVERVASRTGRSRIPVYDGDLDRVRGIVHVKDLLALDPAGRERTRAGDLARPALITPESRPVEDLMLDMREARQHVAIVVDEYGTVTGLVALEDLIEEIIGEFEDESDRRDRPLRRRFDGALVLPAALRPDELRDRAGVELPEGEWETVAGFVIARLGRIPHVGDTVRLGALRFVVTKMDGHRLVDLALHLPDDADRG
jgi:CBS domain containing-hemolysin-like protein